MIRDIQLFDFQTDAKNYLLDKTTDTNSKHKIILKSPTGSGKTIIRAIYRVEELNLKIKDICPVLIKGSLEEVAKTNWECSTPFIGKENF